MNDIEKLEKKLREQESNAVFFRQRAKFAEEEADRLRIRLGKLKLEPAKPKRVRKPKEFPIRIAENVFLTEQENYSRMVGGSDYGVEGKVIAKTGTKKLVWYKGHTGWSGVGTQSYYGGALVGFDSNAREIMFKGHYEAGNTLKLSLETNDEAIKDFLGIDFSLKDKWQRGTTMVI